MKKKTIVTCGIILLLTISIVICFMKFRNIKMENTTQSETIAETQSEELSQLYENIPEEYVSFILGSEMVETSDDILVLLEDTDTYEFHGTLEDLKKQYYEQQVLYYQEVYSTELSESIEDVKLSYALIDVNDGTQVLLLGIYMDSTLTRYYAISHQGDMLKIQMVGSDSELCGLYITKDGTLEYSKSINADSRVIEYYQISSDLSYSPLLTQTVLGIKKDENTYALEEISDTSIGMLSKYETLTETFYCLEYLDDAYAESSNAILEEVTKDGTFMEINELENKLNELRNPDAIFMTELTYDK